MSKLADVKLVITLRGAIKRRDERGFFSTSFLKSALESKERKVAQQEQVNYRERDDVEHSLKCENCLFD